MEQIYDFKSHKPTSAASRTSTKYHQEILDEVITLGRPYIHEYPALYDDVQKNTSALRYGQGGLDFSPFGIYHPTSVLDKISINSARGRSLLKPSSKGNYSYLYHLDSNNRAIAIECGRALLGEPGDKSITFLLYHDPITFCLSYWKKYYEREFSLCDITWIEHNANGNTFYEVTCGADQDRLSGICMTSEILSPKQNNQALCERFEYMKDIPMIHESFQIHYDEKDRIIGVTACGRRICKG